MPWRNANYRQIYHTASTWACNYYMLLSMWGDDMGRPSDCNGLQGATPQNPLAEPFPNSQPRQTVDDKKMIDIALIHWFGANYFKNRDFPGGTSGLKKKKNWLLMQETKRHGFDPWVRKSSGGGHGNPLQYSHLENPMDRGTCWVTVHRVTKSWIWLNQFSTHYKNNN